MEAFPIGDDSVKFRAGEFSQMIVSQTANLDSAACDDRLTIKELSYNGQIDAYEKWTLQ